MECRHRHTGIENRKLPPHPICNECRALSVGPKESDFWICHECGGLNLYAARKSKVYGGPRDFEVYPIYLKMAVHMAGRR